MVRFDHKGIVKNAYNIADTDASCIKKKHLLEDRLTLISKANFSDPKFTATLPRFRTKA